MPAPASAHTTSGASAIAGDPVRCYYAGVLCPTPPKRLVDERGVPYFLWDCTTTLAELRVLLVSTDLHERAYWVGKTMRQAKPDDALVLIPRAHMTAPEVERFLGHTRAFWHWLLPRLAP